MATDYGSDFAGVDDIDAALSSVDGPLCVAQAVMRRWLHAAGTLFYDQSYGAGLSGAVGGSTPAAMLASRLEAQALEDERVQACRVSVSQIGEALRITGALRLEQGGTFTFVFELSPGGSVRLLELQ